MHRSPFILGLGRHDLVNVNLAARARLRLGGGLCALTQSHSPSPAATSATSHVQRWSRSCSSLTSPSLYPRNIFRSNCPVRPDQLPLSHHFSTSPKLSTTTQPFSSSKPTPPHTNPDHLEEQQVQEPPMPSKSSKLKSLTKEYGLLSVLVYFSISLVTFTICFTSITFLGVDKETVFGLLHKAKEMIGIASAHPPAPTVVVEDAEGNGKWTDYLPEFLKTETAVNIGTNILLAMAMTKLFLPIKVTVVAFLTPWVARRLRAAGFDFGKRGYREMAKDARGRYRDHRAAKRAASSDRE
ncbi:hypothetical protein HDV05_004165 [Chytridiales sp. JEL 0842]|nr:hypothetical protein HDV05_004165 [Chytridiales sp. JEL 0842]